MLPLMVLLVISGSCNKNSTSQGQNTSETHGIIPLPVRADLMSGSFTADGSVIISGDELFSRAVSCTSDAFQEILGQQLKTEGDTTGKQLIIFTPDNSLKVEGYTLKITRRSIKITAKTGNGAFYAAQTLKQLIWAATDGGKSKSFQLRCIDVEDAPKYSWRGFHIDLSRHLFTKQFLENVIDELAYYKLNKLHLHLSDDEGWRVEIDRFPLLTTKSAWREFNSQDSTCLARSASDAKYEIDSRFISTSGGKTLYGGFFTKQDLREIIEYAGNRFIEIIPEIDMPGHMSAAINSYPYLSCTGTPGWGKEFSYPVCPCNQDVMDFCHQVYDEIAGLFPSGYIHLGSDEVEQDTWTGSDACRSFMENNHIQQVSGIQSWFVSDMQKYLEAKGKTVVVWDDVIDGTAGKDLVMMYWRDWVTDSPARCAANGNKIVLTPWSPFYLSNDHTDKALQDIYEYDPDKVFPAGVNAMVIGLQGCLWTEEIPSELMFEYMVYPRLEALAETEWASGKDWTTFRIRLISHLKYLKSKNIQYRRPAWAN